MMKKLVHYSSYIALAFSFLVPYMALAAGINLGAITPYSTGIIDLINKVIVPVLFAVAFLYFIYGVYKYFILGADNDTERATGRQFVLWSVIGFAVILSVWGLVNVVLATFNLTSGSAPRYPTL
jgi:ABC-type dipeptide/oligopeptide/nickel transport system permease subunit